MLLIGSQAMKEYVKLDRVPQDTDRICYWGDFKWWMYHSRKHIISSYPTSEYNYVVHTTYGIYEFNIAHKDSSNEKLLLYCEELCEGKPLVAPLDVLLAIKLSHRYLKNSPHFLKTMRDIHLLRKAGAKVTDPVLLDILKLREEETYTYNHPKLSQSKDDFFVKDDSFYKYDHDDIHTAVATLDKPAYLYFKPNDSEVQVSKRLWDACSEDVKLRAGLEESYVLALERSLIPSGLLSPKEAFDKALEKVCSSITSGWFREYCWENYDNIQALYDASYVDKFHSALSSGAIRDFKCG